LVSKQRLAERLAQALGFFEAHHIDVLLIKGFALDQLVYVPHALTTSLDVDLVLRVKQSELSLAEQRAIADVTHGCPLEYDFYEHHDVTLNGALPIDFGRVWRDAVPLPLAGHPAWVMCPEDLLLTACINACRKRFYQLKALCDIAEILRTYPDLNWAGIARRAQADRCQTIVYVAITAAALYLNARWPSQALDLLAVAPPRAALLRYLVAHTPLHHWTAPKRGFQILNRQVNASLVLPYLTYSWEQVKRKLRFVGRSRRALVSAGDER
jgi:hypothetical protein